MSDKGGEYLGSMGIYKGSAHINESICYLTIGAFPFHSHFQCYYCSEHGGADGLHRNYASRGTAELWGYNALPCGLWVRDTNFHRMGRVLYLPAVPGRKKVIY